MENPIESIDSVSQRSAVKQVAFYFGLALVGSWGIAGVLFRNAMASKDVTIEVLKTENANLYKEKFADKQTIGHTLDSYKELIQIVSPAFEQFTVQNRRFLDEAKAQREKKK